jgi:hypothetical protein
MRVIFIFTFCIFLASCNKVADYTSSAKEVGGKKEPIPTKTSELAWKLKTSVDPITDKTTKEAYIIDSPGNKLTILRRSDGSVWAYIQLSGINQFGINEELIFRVDKNEPMEFNDNLEKLSEKYGKKIQSWEWNPNLIGFRMWHGKADEGCGYIQQLYFGKELIVRYHPNPSTQKDIVFAIDKNQDAIIQALDLQISLCAKK